MPKVSVIMSVYNGEKYLKESIDSILSQTFTDFEVIIINDGSTDKTSEILESYNDKRIKIIHQENIGLTKSLNKGIKLAKGEYIARMDADDIALPERFEKQIKFLENNIDVGLVGSAYFLINYKGEIISKRVFPNDDSELRKILIKYNPFLHSSIMIRIEVFNKVGLYNENIPYAQDYELYFRVAKHFKIANLKEILMMKRYTKSIITIENESEQLKYAVYVRKRAISDKQYSLWNYIYLIRPYIAMKTPAIFKTFLRKYILNSKKVYQALEKDEII